MVPRKVPRRGLVPTENRHSRFGARLVPSVVTVRYSYAPPDASSAPSPRARACVHAPGLSGAWLRPKLAIPCAAELHVTIQPPLGGLTSPHPGAGLGRLVGGAPVCGVEGTRPSRTPPYTP